MKETYDHEVTVTKLQALGIAAKLEKTLLQMYNESVVLRGSINEHVFMQIVENVFGKTVLVALKNTIKKEPYD